MTKEFGESMNSRSAPFRSLYANALTQIGGLKAKPKAILAVSAHWETENGLEITSAATPSLLFDYYGFPAELYPPHFSYPVAGEPKLAQRVQELLASAGVKATLNAERGLDHGVFIPLKVCSGCFVRSLADL
jgi:aromatic ring-opening dioxygenase catalytic subunit (LigB family)